MVLCELATTHNQTGGGAGHLIRGWLSDLELMITVMDMETSYVIVVYSNDLSFTTSAHAAISHPSTTEDQRQQRRWWRW